MARAARAARAKNKGHGECIHPEYEALPEFGKKCYFRQTYYPVLVYNRLILANSAYALFA